MDNYKEVKNHIHNTLKITKDDIQDTIQKTVVDEIHKLMEDSSFINELVRYQVKNILRDKYTKPKYKRLFSLNELIYDRVCDEISKTVKENIQIKVGLNTDNLETYDFKQATLFDDINIDIKEES